VDWNNDNKKDLLVGEREGQIRIFINSGTNASPVFTGFTYLEVGGSTFDCGWNSMLFVTDWDEDGKKDLIVGEHDGKIILLLNVNTDADPVFTTESYLLNGGGIMDIGGRTSPVVVDWDGDGKKDILAGEKEGNVFFIRNIGTNSAPEFNGFTLLEAGGALIDVDYNSRPFVVDWDNDGTMDLFSGSFDTVAQTGLGPLSTDDNQISVATGGTLNFSLDAGTGNANRNYLVLGSISGTEPGYTLPGGQAVLPLNFDVYTDVIFVLLNTVLFDKFMGKLDGAGQAAAQLNAPVIPPIGIGAILYHAYCLNSPFDYVSNPIQVELIP
jgi:hypothetical protein